jgi:ABC-type sugar transport system substrate-binding protein
MNIASVSKAIGGATAAAAGSVATTFFVVPPDVAMPWYGYVVVGALNFAAAFGITYYAPRNR